MREHLVPQLVMQCGGSVWKGQKNEDICCFYCCHSFSGDPVPLPLGYDSRKDTFYVAGQVCCSINCAKACIIQENRSTTPNRLVWLNQIARRCFDLSGPFNPAPPRELLQCFTPDGLTIEEFRRTFKTLKLKLDFPPMIEQTQQLYKFTTRQIYLEELAAKQEEFKSRKRTKN